MLIVRPLVNAAPAMPALSGRRICIDCRPWPTSDHSSAFLASCRKSVERSALSMRVASAITLRSMTRMSISEVTWPTTSRNSSSCARRRCMRSTICTLCSAMALWPVISCSRSRSALVNRPRRLFSTCDTPMISPRPVATGTHIRLRVLKPVCSSLVGLKRGSA